MQIYKLLGIDGFIKSLGIRSLPDNNSTDGSIIMQFMAVLEHWGIVKVMEAEGHVPFEKAMNGTTISFLVHDWIIWAIIGFTVFVTFISGGVA